MHIITPARWVEPETYYLRMFLWRTDPHAGFSFDLADPTDPTSPPVTRNPAAAAHLAGCLDGTFDVVDQGAVACTARGYRIPAVGRCTCGRSVELDGFTNTCGTCGRDYNSAGQELAPRACWGEETGESAADLLCGGDPFDGGW